MRKNPLFFTFLMVTLFFMTASLQGSNALPEAVEPYYDYRKVLAEVNSDAIMGHIAYLSNLGSRVTGYPGSYKASEYIASRFQEYGLEPLDALNGSYFQNYLVTVPLEHEASITVLPEGPVFKAHALWPNGVQTCRTPSGGIEGILLYGGEGTLGELSEAAQRLGIDLEDSIALLEFNSIKDWITMDNWVRAAAFGVKAIIFIAPKDTNRLEAESKYLKTPINVPRLYINETEALSLKILSQSGSPIRVRIELDMKFEDVLAKNVIGVIKGSDFPDDVIIFSAYYDCWSIVPALAPGADEASGIATLLELAKFFASHKPRRTLWFVAFSGHWQAMAGAREFVEKFYFSDDVLSGRTKLYLLMNLHISSESPTITYVNYGAGYGYSNTRHLVSIISIMEQCRKPLEDLGFPVSSYVEVRWDTGLYMDSYFVHEAEVVAVARSASLSYVTTRCARLSWGSPFSKIEKVHSENLRIQASFIFASAYTLANIDSLGLSWDMVSPKRYHVEAGYGLPSGGFARLEGDVSRFDPTTRWYTFEGLENYDILVRVGYIGGYMVMPNPVMTYIVKASPNGTFAINGVGADAAFGLGWVRTPTHVIQVFCINRTTGAIEWFSDSGMWSWSSVFGLDRPVKFVRTSVFKCASATLYGFNYTAGLQVNSFQTHAPPVFWGLIPSPQAPSMIRENVVMVFLPDKTTFEVIQVPNTILINASEQYPEGAGFTIDAQRELRINVPIQAAKDLYFLNRERYRLGKRFDVSTPLGEHSIEASGAYLEKVFKALEARDYEGAYGAAMAAMAWQTIGYGEMSSLIRDMTYASLSFSVLLIPFMFLAERLFFPSQGKKRIASLLIAFTIPYLAFYFAHPGSQVALAAPIAIEGYAMLFFTAIVLITVSGNLGSLMREIREKTIGLHFAEISRSGAFLSAMSAGIEDIRKRKLRSFLTMLSIILMTFSLVSLASSYGIVSPVAQRMPSPSYELYPGILIQRLAGFDPITYDMMVMSRWGTIGREYPAVYRAWYYPSWSPDPLSIRPVVQVMTPKGSYDFWAVLGLMPQEIGLNTKLSEGLEGRWFEEGDEAACILSKNLAEKMGIQIGGSIVYSGLDLKVVGLLDDETFSHVIDLDGRGLAPIDVWSVAQLARALDLPLEQVRLMAREVIPTDHLLIVPFRLARKVFGAPVYSIAIKMEDFPKATKDAQELVTMMTLPLTVYASGDGSIYLHSRRMWYSLIGFQHLFILYVIVSLSVLMAMLNAVYERTGEIKIFSAVGLAPLHVVAIFLIQSLLYGVVGSVVGYLAGLAALRVLILMKFFPPEFIPNFAASAAFLPMGLTIAATVLSALYPALKASRLVTPSLERKWKLTTKPVGDEWSIGIPFRASEGEVLGILEFMREYMASQAAEAMGPFITMTEPKIRKEEGSIVMDTRVHLAPFDANVTQAVFLMARPQPNVAPPIYDFHLHLRLLSGNRETWIRSNRSFIDKIRRQLLIWRGLRDVDRQRYLGMVKEV
jgi:hypothetical protein